MHHNLDLIKAIGHATVEETKCEVYAEAQADYDEPTHTLTVTLESYCRPDDLQRLNERLVPDWLPRPQVDREHVDADEASDLAKEIFQRWCSKVAGSVPHLRP